MTQTGLYLTVAVPTPLRQEFEYLPPEGVGPAALLAGVRIEVPFGNKKVVGILTGTHGQSALAPSRLKRALRLLDAEPILPEPLFRLCRWAADYYHHPLGEVFSSALPVALRRGDATAQEGRELVLIAGLEPEGKNRLARAPRQREIVDALVEAGGRLAEEQVKDRAFSASALKQLIARARVEWQLTLSPPLQPFPVSDPVQGTPLRLNPEQRDAFDAIAGLPPHEPGCALLHGVTGSGKTEIYLQLIERVVREGKQALVLVPEIGLTPQALSRFRDRFRVPVAVLHSGLGDRERFEAWRAAASGACAIVIGTRSAIFTPLRNPGLIIVDEEHDHSFKQQEGFRYSARDLAVMRGRMEQVPVVLGSATPSLESLHNAHGGRYRWLRLTKRAGGAADPVYRLLDIRSQPLDEGFSQPLVQLIGEHLLRDNQAMIFINRRGYAPTLLCHQCGWMAQCTRCDARLTLHLLSSSLQCHHCGERQGIVDRCPQCGAAELARLGFGTERTERTLRRLFPDQPVLRIDRDTMRRRNAMASIIERIERGGSAILVGTQILAKGHHFPHLTLVAVLDADAGFFSSDFRAVETMGQLLLQVTGRTGRWEKEGMAVIQTHFPDHPLLLNLTQHGYESFADTLLSERRDAGLPPFGYMALVRAEALRQEMPLAFLSDAARIQRRAATRHAGGVEVLGPIPSAMEKKAGRYRAQLLLQAQQRAPLHALLDATIPAIEALPLARRVRWSIDIDPLDTL